MAGALYLRALTSTSFRDGAAACHLRVGVHPEVDDPASIVIP